MSLSVSSQIVHFPTNLIAQTLASREECEQLIADKDLPTHDKSVDSITCEMRARQLTQKLIRVINTLKPAEANNALIALQKAHHILLKNRLGFSQKENLSTNFVYLAQQLKTNPDLLKEESIRLFLLTLHQEKSLDTVYLHIAQLQGIQGTVEHLIEQGRMLFISTKDTSQIAQAFLLAGDQLNDVTREETDKIFEIFQSARKARNSSSALHGNIFPSSSSSIVSSEIFPLISGSLPRPDALSNVRTGTLDLLRHFVNMEGPDSSSSFSSSSSSSSFMDEISDSSSSFSSPSSSSSFMDEISDSSSSFSSPSSSSDSSDSTTSFQLFITGGSFRQNIENPRSSITNLKNTEFTDELAAKRAAKEAETVFDDLSSDEPPSSVAKSIQLYLSPIAISQAAYAKVLDQIYKNEKQQKELQETSFVLQNKIKASSNQMNRLKSQLMSATAAMTNMNQSLTAEKSVKDAYEKELTILLKQEKTASDISSSTSQQHRNLVVSTEKQTVSEKQAGNEVIISQIETSLNASLDAQEQCKIAKQAICDKQAAIRQALIAVESAEKSLHEQASLVNQIKKEYHSTCTTHDEEELQLNQATAELQKIAGQNNQLQESLDIHTGQLDALRKKERPTTSFLPQFTSNSNSGGLGPMKRGSSIRDRTQQPLSKEGQLKQLDQIMHTCVQGSFTDQSEQSNILYTLYKNLAPNLQAIIRTNLIPQSQDTYSEEDSVLRKTMGNNMSALLDAIELCYKTVS